MSKMNFLIVVEQVFILNHYDWTKIEENIHALIPLENHRKGCYSGKVEVTLFTAGQIHKEVVQATDYQSAKRTAQARNPEATIVSVTAVF